MDHSDVGWHFKIYLLLLLTACRTSTKAQDCVIEPYVRPADDVTVYVYHGYVTLQRTWSENYLNPDHSDYKQLYNDIYTELFKVFSCQLDETKTIFYGLTNITFSKGSVKTDWDLVLNESVPDGDLLSAKAGQELNNTTAFKEQIIDPAVQDQLNFVFATIGAVAGVITLLGMLYSVFKKMKKLTVKGKQGGLSGMSSSLGADKLTQPKPSPTSDSVQSTQPEPEAPAAPEVLSVTVPQGYAMSQDYIIADQGQYATQMASTGQYNNDTLVVQAQGYIMPAENGTMVVGHSFNQAAS